MKVQVLGPDAQKDASLVRHQLAWHKQGDLQPVQLAHMASFDLYWLLSDTHEVSHAKGKHLHSFTDDEKQYS